MGSNKIHHRIIQTEAHMPNNQNVTHDQLGRLYVSVYGIYKRRPRAPTKENTLVLIAVDIGGKNTE